MSAHDFANVFTAFAAGTAFELWIWLQFWSDTPKRQTRTLRWVAFILFAVNIIYALDLLGV